MKNPRRHILIHPAFQLRFAALFTLAVATFTMIFPIFVYTSLLQLDGHPYFQKSSAALQALKETRFDLLVFLCLSALVTITSAFALSLFHSHKIAGPLYKLRMAMISLQQGVLDRRISFRRGDNFMEMADGFNAMVDSISIRRQRDFERVQSVLPKLERLQSSLSGEAQATVSQVLMALQELSNEGRPPGKST
jgi:methyl-accepting chemotaxis protein